MRKQIAGFEFRNSVFGMNRGHLTRVEDGYVVGKGDGSDPMFFRSAVEAKQAYRDTISTRDSEREFSPLDRFGERTIPRYEFDIRA